MEEKGNKVNFDLSILSLEELIGLYEKIIDFLRFLDSMKIEEEEKAGK